MIDSMLYKLNIKALCFFIFYIYSIVKLYFGDTDVNGQQIMNNRFKTVEEL
jgi:hypothetical protein